MKLKKEDYARMVLDSRILFRDGIQEFMGLSSKLDVPLYVVSGGIQEVIDASFSAIMHNGELQCDAARMCWETMGIYSNSFEYHEDRTVDYRKPIIHILNKQ